MNKILWLTGLIIFVFVTVFVVSLDTTDTRRVQFSNQDFAIKNEGNDVVNNSIHGANANIKFNDSKISNVGVSATNVNSKISATNIELDNVSNFNTKNVKFSDNDTQYNNQDLEIETQGTGFKSHKNINYKNLDTENLDEVLKNAKNYKYQHSDVSNKPVQSQVKYKYKNIDWKTWRSEFVNKILDDSLAIRSLDSYQKGAWFYYSFDVSDKGVISNIKIKSMYLSEQDKSEVARLIKSYQYKPITVFPANTHRKTVNVSAVMMLSNETKHSRPNDFNDFEKIKFQVK